MAIPRVGSGGPSGLSPYLSFASGQLTQMRPAVSGLGRTSPVSTAQKTASANPAQAQMPEDIQGMLKQITELLKMVLALLSGQKPSGNPPATSGAGGAGGAGGGGGGGGGGADAAGGMPRTTPAGDSFEPGPGTSGIQVDDPRLQAALDKIAQDPEGAKLLEAAKARGLTSISVNPGLNPDGGAGTQGVTYGNGSGSRIEIADPNSPDLIRTLVHELGHAATPENGNSRAEEQLIDAVGGRVQQRLTGHGPGYGLNMDAYSYLPSNNGILDAYRRMGINV